MNPGGEPGRLLMMHQMECQGEEVHRLRDEMSSLVENSYDGIIIADHERILQVNASFGRITGVVPSLLISKCINELDSPRHVCLAAVQEIIRITYHHSKPLTLQRRLRSGNEIFITCSRCSTATPRWYELYSTFVISPSCIA